MKALLLAAAATLFMTGAANAVDMTQKTKAECMDAIVACDKDPDPVGCKKLLQVNNGCDITVTTTTTTTTVP